MGEQQRAPKIPGGKYCAGYVNTGHWRGHPCGAVPKYHADGKWWCKNHLPLEHTHAEKE